MTLRVLSVRHPWAWAVLHAGKDVENRTWTTAHRGMVAIQAGRLPAADAREKLRAMGIEVPAGLPTGVVLGVVDLVGIVRDSGSPWAVPGRWHWQLANPRPLAEPVSLLGRQSLFTASAAVERAVRAQL